MGPQETMAALLAGIAGLVWLIRLEGRVNGHDREMRDVKDDLAYIRARIDSAIDGSESRR